MPCLHGPLAQLKPAAAVCGAYIQRMFLRICSAACGLFVFSVIEPLYFAYYGSDSASQSFTKDANLSGLALVGTLIGQVMSCASAKPVHHWQRLVRGICMPCSPCHDGRA